MFSKKIVHLVRICAVALLLLAGADATAQDSAKVLSMDEAVHAARQQNRDVEMARIDEEIAGENYKKASAIFLPQVSVNYTALTTNDPLDAFGFKLQQRSIKESDFNPETLNRPGSTPEFMTQLSVRQPILNLDMLYQRKSALKETDIYRFKTKRTEEFIDLQVQQAYLQLKFAWDAQKVVQEALSTARAVYHFTSDRFSQGLVQQSDLLNVQVQVRGLETNLSECAANIRNASDNLSQLMNKPQGVIYSASEVTLDVQDSTVMTLPDNRADLNALQSAMEASKLMIKSARANYLPRINAFADYQLHDNTPLGFGSGGYLAGIQLSWDIFKGFERQHAITGQRLEYRKQVEQLQKEKDAGRAEINKANQRLSTAGYRIKQQQEAIAQAAESLRILENRYRQGLVNTTDVLMAEAQLSQQKLAFASAIFDRNSAWVYLRFLTAKQ